MTLLICEPQADRHRFLIQERLLTGSDPQHSFRLQAKGTPETVRVILSDLRARVQALGISEDQCGTIEIAMAEALNNIIEHAYAPECEGPLRLDVSLGDTQLQIETRDIGHPLPGLDLPVNAFPDASGPLDSLPEGGFGWFLIRELTNKVEYTRKENKNHLTLVFAINPTDPA